jgi:hypothetical protein
MKLRHKGHLNITNKFSKEVLGTLGEIHEIEGARAMDSL